ncbi:protein SSUH2 homolog [Engystomops pustulosus]|uniref:protein SSUH2 homolog n=1 Tax=Engystomops pustulosus TaxID=76066 RepID=UPI003AFA0B6E
MEKGVSLSSDQCPPCDASNRDPRGYRNVVITVEAAGEAVRKYLSSCCCRPRAEEPVIERLTQMPLYRYRLDTFTESRNIEKTCKPYTGQRIDAPRGGTGTATQLWDIRVQTPQHFQEGTKKFPLPGSGEIKVCGKCTGRGRCKCSRCGGSGQFRCQCPSSRQKSRSKRCSGSGRRRCSKCSGRGRRICVSCRGEGRLLYYQQVAVKWKTLRAEVVSHPPELDPALPLILLHKVTGEEILMDDDVTVLPLSGFAEVPELSAASERFIQDHRNVCGPWCHVLRQRQTVELIPVALVQYGFSGKSLSCHVYGQERRVYARQRLHRLPFGCSVL